MAISIMAAALAAATYTHDFTTLVITLSIDIQRSIAFIIIVVLY
jgi:hypothetical protein